MLTLASRIPLICGCPVSVVVSKTIETVSEMNRGLEAANAALGETTNYVRKT